LVGKHGGRLFRQSASGCAEFHGGKLQAIPDPEREQIFRKRNEIPRRFLGVPPESLDQKLARFLRQQRGTQTFAQFARKLGVSGSTLHRIENGQQSATLQRVQQFLRALHCDYEDVFGSGALLKAAETPGAEKPAAPASPGRRYQKKPRRRKPR
jgi:transcriptional regulator with XRE-family HTH domain